MERQEQPLLDIRGLSVHFPLPRGGLLSRGARRHVRAVDDVDLDIRRGETLGLVGESGCGKTTIGRAIAGLNTVTGGRIAFEGETISATAMAAKGDLRRRVQYIFQDPYASLNPRMRVGEAIAEPVRLHGLRTGSAPVKERVEELLSLVGLSGEYASRYPAQFSGGQRQRIGIARALACEPDLIVCDEPVSALDVSVQAQVVNLLQDLQQRFGLTYLFIAHGLSVVQHICDRIAVMYLGRIVELGDREDICQRPRHPYTRALLSAVPIPDPAVERHRRRIVLRGELPSPIDPPSGCRFRTRCPLAVDACAARPPPLAAGAGGHAVACWRLDEVDRLMPRFRAEAPGPLDRTNAGANP